MKTKPAMTSPTDSTPHPDPRIERAREVVRLERQDIRHSSRVFFEPRLFFERRPKRLQRFGAYKLTAPPFVRKGGLRARFDALRRNAPRLRPLP